MLKRLYIRNLALIEECELELHEGLNIITGETGAGKSLLLGSLDLLLGNKADRGMIRKGAKEAYVEAVFELSDRQRLEIVNQSALDLDENLLIVSRRISMDRNYAKINNETVTNKVLNSVVGCLINICGQRDNMILLNKESHLRLLDSYAYHELYQELLEVSKAFQEYKRCYLAISEFDMEDEERIKKLDYLQFVSQEIEEAELEIGEDESLESNFTRMNHSLKINELLEHTKQAFRTIDFSDVLKYLNKIKEYDTGIEPIYSKGMDIEAELSDFLSEIDDYASNMNFSEEEFKLISDRLDLINHLKFKYGKTIEEILRFQENTRAEIEKLTKYQERKEKANSELIKVKSDLEKKCIALSEHRKKSALLFCNKLKEILLDLQFNHVEIEAKFEKTDGYTIRGFDKMGLLVCLNKGEELKPLEEVASGGELSRIMLAIKSLHSNDVDEKILIFDEIDTGIGGKTALSIANRLELLSKSRQVISITHLASIAAAADYHYKIYKKETKDRTNTYIEVLDYDSSITEVARMIGGDETSSIAIDNAKELKKQLKGERIEKEL